MTDGGKEGELRESFARLSSEAIALRRQPPNPARRARLAQIDRERNRLARLIREIEEARA
ncbi:MAG: hypothetical protein OXG99_13505 [Alphaproteobacteria bacterium]|nr:hypothetical protein [Alphaproteobacteria bacterium]